MLFHIVEVTMASGQLTRRDVVRRAGGVVLMIGAGPALLAACGGTDTPAVESGSGEVGGSIDYISWEGYDLLSETAPWQRSAKVRLNSTYIGSSDDSIAKIKSRSVGYDLTTYNVTGFDEWLALGIVTPIDEDAIPNIETMYPFFREGETSDKYWTPDGVRYGVPFTWGSIACNYRPDKVPAPKSWLDLLEPPYAGKVGVVDDWTTFTLAGRILGLEPPNYTPEQFDQCADLLRKVVAAGPGVAPSYGDLTNQLVAADIVATFLGWSAVDTWAADKGVEVISVVPSEGSFGFADAFAIPPTADNRATVHAFINEALTPQVQAAQAKALVAGVVTPDAVPLLDDTVAGLYDYDSIESVLEASPLYDGPPLTDADGYVTKEGWVDEWNAIKAGR
jgi:spermidine/putrescine-binding protein